MSSKSASKQASSSRLAARSRQPTAGAPVSLVASLKDAYTQKTPGLVKVLDVYLLFCMATGILQAVYYLAAGSPQYNAFLGGFISSVGSFVLAGTPRPCHPPI